MIWLDSEPRSFDSKVCLGIPSIAAAPFAPETRPDACRNAFSIIVFSWEERSETNVVARTGDFELSAANQLASTENVSPSQRMTARSITFCNSRTFPGQL